MITPKDWADACKKEGGQLFYNDCGVCYIYALGTRLFYARDEFFLDIGRESLPLSKIYKTEKESAVAFIADIKKQYGV
jgi:hypothetical protein